MKIEKIELKVGENTCSMEEAVWNPETQTHETKTHVGTGYRVCYMTFCEACFHEMMDGIKIMDANKKIKSIEI